MTLPLLNGVSVCMYASNCLSRCQNDPIIKFFLLFFLLCGYFKTTATKSNHLNITLYWQISTSGGVTTFIITCILIEINISIYTKLDLPFSYCDQNNSQYYSEIEIIKKKNTCIGKIETFLFLNITVLVMALKYTQNKVIGLSDKYPYQIFDTSASSALKTF